jgi:ElaB/YqjD/DUF883 family membrane-anchored ribosome-binding protein
MLSDVRGSVGKFGDRARERFQEVAAGADGAFRQAGAVVRGNPGRAVTVAFGVGVAVGVAVGLTVRTGRGYR